MQVRSKYPLSQPFNVRRPKSRSKQRKHLLLPIELSLAANKYAFLPSQGFTLKGYALVCS